MVRLRRPRETRARVLAIVNPHASAVDPDLRELVTAALAGRYELSVRDTARRGHATDLAREAVQEGFALVVTVGGDGTAGEAAGGLAGTDLPLFPMPAGSQNVYAKLLGIPDDIVDATSLLLAVDGGIPARRVDLGTVNDRVFAFCAGAGIDADTVEQVDARPERKARWREWYYMATVGRVAAARYLRRPPMLEVSAADQSVRGITVLIQNGPSYTYAGDRPIEACDNVRLDDGRLSAAVLLRKPTGLPTVALRLYSRRLKAPHHRAITTLDHVEAVRVVPQGAGDFAIQADGDFIGRFEEARFGILPGALKVFDVAQADGVTR